MSAAKIKKGDKVVILAGKDKGRTGAVLQVLPKEERVLVEGLENEAVLDQRGDERIDLRFLQRHVSVQDRVAVAERLEVQVRLDLEGRRQRHPAGSLDLADVLALDRDVEDTVDDGALGTDDPLDLIHGQRRGPRTGAGAGVFAGHRAGAGRTGLVACSKREERNE